jgi:hypothetical protein
MIHNKNNKTFRKFPKLVNSIYLYRKKSAKYKKRKNSLYFI